MKGDGACHGCGGPRTWGACFTCQRMRKPPAKVQRMRERSVPIGPTYLAWKHVNYKRSSVMQGYRVGPDGSDVVYGAQTGWRLPGRTEK